MNQRRLAELDAFVIRVSTRLKGTAWLLTGDRQAAEDVTQEALIAVFRNWHRIETPEARYSYAHISLCRAAFRHTKRERRLEQKLRLLEVESTDSCDPDLTVTLFEAFKQLTDGQHRTVVLRFFAGLSVRETARVLNCSEGTVKSQTSRALSKLREVLDEESSGAENNCEGVTP